MKRPLVPFTIALALTSTLALAEIPELSVQTREPSAVSPPQVRAIAPVRPEALEPAPRDTARLPVSDEGRELVRDLDAWFSMYATHRHHVALDRPLYRPGETVSVKIWDLATRGLAQSAVNATLQLVDPRGTVIESRHVQGERSAHDTFALDGSAPGGSWKIQLVTADGQVIERPFTVASFQAPRVKKTLAFVRDAYRPGEEVEAALTFERATGEPLANVTARVQVQVAGVALAPMELRTDARGEGSVKFPLPDSLASPDVILTVLVDDGGVTESISRPVPVQIDRVSLGLFPEGGALVAGLPSRVYFEATDAHGEPAEVSGRVEDDRGREVARFESWTLGRGHFTFIPEEGRTYQARLEGDTPQTFPLPEASGQGCVLRHHDDLEGAQRAVRVSVRCSEDQDVVVLASQQEQLIDRATVHVVAGRATTVHLKSADKALSGAQGVARVTVLQAPAVQDPYQGGGYVPLAERLVYRNKGRQLKVALTADKERYAPGDEVTLTVRTTDPEGRAVPAELSLAVVDDTLLSFADDDEDHLMSRVLLQADLPEPIEAAADLLQDEEDGGLGLDLVLGTRGWRTFDWQQVAYASEQLVAIREEERQMRLYEALADGEGWGWGPRVVEEAMPGGDWGGVALAEVPMAPPPMVAPTVAVESTRAPRGRAAPEKRAKAEEAKDDDVVPVRVFAPPLPGDGPVVTRSDFRDTVLWQPAVRTGRSGQTRVKFKLSDAVTGFRATAEGIGDSWLGRGETLIASSLPLHLETRLPVELSAGDKVLLPVTVENQRPTTLSVDLTAEVSPLLALQKAPGKLSLRSGERKTVHVPLTAVPGRGQAELSLVARAGNLTDAVAQKIPVVPRGFPMGQAFSGVLSGKTRHVVVIPEATEGSIHGRVQLFPTPVAEMLEGVEGMVRTPGGCFEQTSSTNYPNVLVLDWLDRTGGGGKLAASRQQILQTGYTILTGYQQQSGGFETWGQGPGKEALSAYGLLQFTDMARVFDVDKRVIADDVAFLYRQRNGRGGYEVTGASAHGYGTAPPEVLDAYITWALVETGHTDISREIEASAQLARKTSDPYRLALAALALLPTRPEAGREAAAKLARLQADDGSFPGSETSITRSENQNLLVEATALSTLAVLRAGDVQAARRGVRWFHDNRGSAGMWGATQANALALKAISEAARTSGKIDKDGHLEVLIDGELVGEAVLVADAQEAIELELGPWLSQGKHTVEISLDGGSMPYTLEVGWSSESPESDPDRRVALEVELADRSLKLGETTRLVASVSNRTSEVVPDPIARIGLPAGLVPQTWQLEQLKERGEIAFFETRPREVTLYWDGLAATEVHEVALDLVAEVPGTFTAPSSSAYPYYDDQAKAWVAGQEVEIAP